jgi:hypothetical protein
LPQDCSRRHDEQLRSREGDVRKGVRKGLRRDGRFHMAARRLSKKYKNPKIPKLQKLQNLQNMNYGTYTYYKIKV